MVRGAGKASRSPGELSQALKKDRSGEQKQAFLVGSEQRMKGRLGNLLSCVHRCFFPGVGHKCT